jgi:peptidoglycan pentaglycine glycine transferase (the first glycine)
VSTDHCFITFIGYGPESVKHPPHKSKETLLLKLLSITNPAEWNQRIKTLPGAHALQTWEWAQVKSSFGWEPHPLVWQSEFGEVLAGALVLQRRMINQVFAMRLSVMYVPRGPLLDWSDRELAQRVLQDLQAFAKKNGAIFIKIDPDLPIGFGIPGEEDADANPAGEAILALVKSEGWRFSDEQIQFRNTVEVDLGPDEEDLLMRMKSKTRYNIRLAARRGVTVEPGGVADIDLLNQMYAHTSVRDDFLIRSKAYYEAVWRTFFKAGLAEPLIAKIEGQPVGAVIIFRFAGRAWYIHGMSLDEHRDKMFNYRLQWEAMLRAKQAGCHTYDMWGAPDTFNEEDPLWGVYRFKDGFGGRVVRTLGAWDLPTRPLIYRLYSNILPGILGWMRKRGKSTTKRSMST